MPVGDTESAVDPARFDGSGTWLTPPAHWADTVDDRLTAEAFAKTIRAGIDELPAMQRDVVSLRDVDGLTSQEVCAVLDITEGHQRVLLHRGRSRLRQALETAHGSV